MPRPPSDEPPTAPLPDDAPDPREVAAAPFPQHPDLPRRIGRWTLDRPVGQGGMGLVFLVHETGQSIPLAMKIAKYDAVFDSANQALEHEAELMAALRGRDRIPSLHFSGEFTDRFNQPRRYFVMDYLGDGVTTIIEHARGAKLPISRRLGLLDQACAAVEDIQADGLAHLDLKPSNILIDERGRLFVTDFGLSRLLITRDGERVGGTYAYMSPEQLTGRVDHREKRCDVFSMGVVAHRLLSDAYPYDVPEEASPDERRDVIERSIAKRASIPPLIAGALRKAVAPRSADRHGDIRALRRSMARRGAIWRSRWAIVLLVGVLASVVGGMAGEGASALAMRAAPTLHGHWIRAVGAWSKHDADTLRHVSIVLYDPTETPFETLAEEAGLEALRLQPNASGHRDWGEVRPIHGALAERLAASRAGAVIFDFICTRPSPRDEAFARGLRTLRDAEIGVVLAEPAWDRTSDGDPKLSPRLLQEPVATGAAAVQRAGTGFVVVLVVDEPSMPSPIPSLTLAGVLAAHARGALPDIDYRPDENAIEVEFFQPDPRRPGGRRRAGARLRLTGFEVVDRFDPPAGGRPNLAHGTDRPMHVVPNPIADERVGPVHDYADVFLAEPSQLQEWFKGRIVLIGSRADTRIEPNGELRLNPVLAAEAIDSLATRNAASISPRRVPQGSYTLVATAGALLALVVAWLIAVPGATRTRLHAARIGVMVMMGGGAVVAAYLIVSSRTIAHGGIPPDPLTASIGMGVAVALVAASVWYVRPFARPRP